MKPSKLAAAVTAGALMAAGITGIGSSPAVGAAEAAATAGVDYNGDGYMDLAVAAPVENIELGGAVAANSGQVTMLYGGPNGLEGLRPYVVQAGDTLGAIASALDSDVATIEALNGLAPGATIAVGQRIVGPGQSFHQETPGVPDIAENDDRWGQIMASGDINGDGYDDLVVSSFNESIGFADKVGAITIMYGGPTGITTNGATQLHQGVDGVPGLNEVGDQWGQALLIADLDGDPYHDIVVGAQAEDIGALQNSGAVTILPGSPNGPDFTRAQLLFQGFNGTPGALEAGDGFGLYLTSTDINGDTFGDLIIGAPFEDIGCLLYTSPSPRDKRQSRMPSSA